MADNQKQIKVAFSSGDPNGVGLELILKTFSDQAFFSDCIPVVYANVEVLSHYNQLAGAIVEIHPISSVDAAQRNVLNVVNCWESGGSHSSVNAGPKSGEWAFVSLEKATGDVLNGCVDALVTGPINKDIIQSISFRFPGHTEYLGDKTGVESPLMLMCSDQLRIGVATGHIPIQEIAGNLTQELILEKLDVFNQSLQLDFGISAPKLAVLGLNPHAGDNGLLGKEEQTIITPAISRAKENNIEVTGPISADGFFGSKSYLNYDGILAMYHDQGLIPFKALSFGNGVNYTAGLPIIRTSPDHGVAYDLVGKNLASPASYQAAVRFAIDITKSRSEKKVI